MSDVALTRDDGERRAWRAAVVVIVAAWLVRLAFAARLPLFPDETYYWDWSRHLAGRLLRPSADDRAAHPRRHRARIGCSARRRHRSPCGSSRCSPVRWPRSPPPRSRGASPARARRCSPRSRSRSCRSPRRDSCSPRPTRRSSPSRRSRSTAVVRALAGVAALQRVARLVVGRRRLRRTGVRVEVHVDLLPALRRARDRAASRRCASACASRDRTSPACWPCSCSRPSSHGTRDTTGSPSASSSSTDSARRRARR